MQKKLNFTKEQPRDGNLEVIHKFLVNHWGSTIIVSQGKVTDATQIPRVVARDSDGNIAGLLTYRIDHEDQTCELVSINSEIEGHGIGTKLIELMENDAREKGYKRIWLITTNDNIESAAFYLKKGYRLSEILLNALEKSRELKTQISKVGKHGIPLLDEWEFEKVFE